MARSKEFEPEVVLGRAMDVFWERGYENSSLQDLVDRMRIGRRSLYDTFGDKRELFLRSLQRYTTLREAAERETADGAESPRQAIRLLFEKSIAEGAILRRGCLAVNSATEIASRDAEIAAQVERHFEASGQLLRELVERGQRDGSITSRLGSKELAATLFNSLLGLRVRVAAGVSLDRLMSDADDTLAVLG